MSHPGRLRAPFALPAGGRWELWVVGQLMPSVVVAVDGRTVARIAGELSGNSLVPNVAPPLTLRLAAGRHVLSVIRGGFTLAPGEGGPAVLYAAFLTRAGAGGDVRLVSQPPARWRRLCAGRYQWVELTGA
jgi:hypothetical protein